MDLEFLCFDVYSSSDESLQEASLVSVLYPVVLTVACGLAEMAGRWDEEKRLLLLLQLLLSENFLKG